MKSETDCLREVARAAEDLQQLLDQLHEVSQTITEDAHISWGEVLFGRRPGLQMRTKAMYELVEQVTARREDLRRALKQLKRLA
jgi:ABC-type transporter Mla subunit MlaD